MTNRLIILSGLSLFFAVGECSGQSFPELKFIHLSPKDGLSSVGVSCIIQDKRGIIWIATQDGLNRYDGTGFRIYRHSANDSSSICNNYVRSMALDDENMLWLGTDNGLCRFNTVTGKAVNYYNQPGNSNSLASNFEIKPFIDSRKRLWLATHAGVQLFDYKKNKFITYNMPSLPVPEGEQHFNYFSIIKEDASHRLWATSFFGMYLIDERQQKLIPFYGEYMATNAFYQVANGSIYLGQWGGGIKRFYPETNKYEQLFQGIKDNSIVSDLIEWRDNNGYNWLCAAIDGGFMFIDLNRNIFRIYKHEILNPFSLNSFFVNKIFKDKENRLWLSTDNGVDILDPRLQYFSNKYLYQQIDSDNPKEMGVPRSVLETENGYLLSSWYNKGLFFFDKNWKLLYRKQRIPENSESVYSGAINKIFKDSSNTIWYATDSGLVKQTRNFYKVFTPPGAESAVRGDYIISDILYRKDGVYWIRARQNGLYLFDPKKEKFLIHYLPGEKNLSGTVYSICFDKQGHLWAGTESGLVYFNEQTDSFVNVRFKKNGTDKDFESVFDIYCDKDNTLWVASLNGLGRVKADNYEATLISLENGLPDNNLIRLQEDTSHMLWIKSQKGIIRYDKKSGFLFFDINNGLPDFYNSYGLFDFNNAGNILSGHNGVLTEFNPYKIVQNNRKPDIVIGEASIDNKETFLLAADSSYSVIMQPGQKTLQLHFSTNSYTSAVSNKYYYKIPGIVNDWLTAPSGNINFTSLPTGKYIIQLKGSNNDGVFSTEQIIHLYVKPYFYQTNWFKILCFVFAGAAIFYFVRRRIITIRKESSFKQKIAETEMQALRAQMNPHFIFNSLNSIENFIMQNEKRLASDYLNKFAKLVRMILDSSRNELVPLAKDMEALQLYIDLEQLRFQNKFSYKTFIDPALLNGDYRVPSLLVQPYVENAIVHGLAHSEEKDLSLMVTATLEKDKIKYMVQDNGIGREKAAAYNRQNKPQHKSVGLKITEDRINLFNKKSAGNGSVRFTDLYDGHGKPAGTKAEITINAI